MADFPLHPPPFADTTWTKVFVGGLAWETQSDQMHTFFQQFGHILEAVIIKDKNTGKSKGYGFVTFRDPESARRACANPNPIICGRRANCNIAAFGRPRPPPPPPSGGRNQIGNPQSTGSYGGSRPPFPPPPPIIFPPYRYRSYAPNYTVPYHQAIYNYNPQLQQPQLYHSSATSSSSGIGSPYYYGYGYGYSSSPSSSSSSQAQRGAFSLHGHGHGPSSPSSSAAAAASYFPYYTNYTQMHHQGLFYTPMHQIVAPSSGWQTPQHTPTETEAGASGSNSPNTS